MEKKQSSIDWLVGQIIFKTEFANLSNQYILMSDKDIDGIIEQAKAMHNKEVISFAKKCLDKALDTDVRTAHSKVEELYNETFGGDNE